MRIITPFPVGGGPEGVVRLVADKLSRTWGQPVIVENKPDKIMRDIEKALAKPDVREKLLSFGYEPFTPTRDQFSQHLQSESIRFANIIKKAIASLD